MRNHDFFCRKIWWYHRQVKKTSQIIYHVTMWWVTLTVLVSVLQVLVHAQARTLTELLIIWNDDKIQLHNMTSTGYRDFCYLDVAHFLHLASMVRLLGCFWCGVVTLWISLSNIFKYRLNYFLIICLKNVQFQRLWSYWKRLSFEITCLLKLETMRNSIPSVKSCDNFHSILINEVNSKVEGVLVINTCMWENFF